MSDLLPFIAMAFSVLIVGLPLVMLLLKVTSSRRRSRWHPQGLDADRQVGLFGHIAGWLDGSPHSTPGHHHGTGMHGAHHHGGGMDAGGHHAGGFDGGGHSAGGGHH